MQTLTRAQREALAHVYDKWRRPLESRLSFRRTRTAYDGLCDVLMVQVSPTMVLGIEPDGHTHS